jgi:hypothetical protein
VYVEVEDTLYAGELNWDESMEKPAIDQSADHPASYLSSEELEAFCYEV